MTVSTHQQQQSGDHAPLRSLIESDYGKATIGACAQVYDSPIGELFWSAADYGKRQLPNSIERALHEKLNTVLSFVGGEEISKTIDTIDHAIDRSLGKTTFISVPKSQIDGTRAPVTEVVAVMAEKARKQFAKVIAQLNKRTEATRNEISETYSTYSGFVIDYSTAQVDRYGPVLAPTFASFVAPLAPLLPTLLTVTTTIAGSFGAGQVVDSFQKSEIWMKLVKFAVVDEQKPTVNRKGLFPHIVIADWRLFRGIHGDDYRPLSILPANEVFN